MKPALIIISLVVSAAAYGANPAGKSSMKLSQGAGETRERIIKTELAKVESEIGRLTQEIYKAEAQALSVSGLRDAEPGLAMLRDQARALRAGLEAERGELMQRRVSLLSELAE